MFMVICPECDEIFYLENKNIKIYQCNDDPAETEVEVKCPNCGIERDFQRT